MPSEPLSLVLRAAGAYATLLIIIRVLGKRGVGAYSAFDLLVALVFGDIAAAMVTGQIGFASGIGILAVLTALELGTSWLTYVSPAASRLLEGVPIVLVRQGELVEAALRQERLSREDVVALLRAQGFDDPAQVKLAVLEVTGGVSVFPAQSNQSPTVG